MGWRFDGGLPSPGLPRKTGEVEDYFFFAAAFGLARTVAMARTLA